MLKLYLLLIVFTTIECYGGHHSHNTHDPNLVHTPLGKILGSTNFKTRLGKTIYSFRGIRFAEPPVGRRRFQAPEPIKSWGEDTFDATVEGPACPQPVLIRPEWGYNASEDCLRLNVYTTKEPKRSIHPRPVIVFFHAGGFYGVSAISNFHGPQYLLDQDIVLVTVNYRLGTLGFISTGDEHAPGNLGLKDQVIALRWVQNNIEAFGGDSQKVTIMGYSAGSISVALHMLSPMSKGLFHRAISMSASPTGGFKYTNNQLGIAQKQARILDCPSNSSLEIIECLRTKGAEEISTTFFSFQEVGQDPTLIWRPVIEPDHTGEKFLTEDPVISLNEGRFMKVPFMVGINELEFASGAYRVITNETLRDIWNKNFSYVAPIAFVYERNTPRSLETSRTLRKFYLGDDPITNKSLDNLGKLYADGVIGFSVNRLANMVVKFNDFPVYYYNFAFKGRYSHFYSPFTNQSIGPTHHDELIYLFYIQLGQFPVFGPNDPETAIVEKLTTLWTNFAVYGNPTPEEQEVTNNIIWSPLTINDKNYLDINVTLSMKKNLFADRYEVWDKLFPIGNLHNA